MADFTIREYKNRDYDAVRRMFGEGMMEHLPATGTHLLKLFQVQLFFFISFLGVLFVSQSYLLSLVTLAILFLAGRWQLNKEFQEYVEQCKREDLLDIEKSYVANDNSCFWVAESNDRVVGMVGAQSALLSNEVMTLRRMSVARDQRGKGIAKALCRKVIDFARQRGYKTVSLETSMVQYAAQRLYENMGFRKTSVQILPTLFGKFAKFSVLTYEFKIHD
ncbi:probable N-acetyltransferase camello [Hyperolius riggenbachi]|uniref:probable N-acetyltransferase camello n=1 Tax=Hyperolius riggenbachi TaxID=752182 RepID=UPI0035A36054